MITHKLIESVSFLMMSLPIIAFACLWYVITFSEREDWRVGFLKAALLWGSATLLITELLSVFAAIRPATLALAWTLVITYSLHIIRRHILEGGESPILVTRRLFALPAGDGWWIVPLVPAAAIAIATAVIALIAPPNNWDSMTYHMSRVEHWRSNGSVAHYPTNVVWQLYLNSWAEFSILQFQTLGFGSDRLANLVQWFAFVGSMVGASLITRLLGGPLFAQSLAALVVASTPMVILESTSTQNDLVCGFFIVAAVYFAFERLATLSFIDEVYFPLSVALAIATKGTAYVILFPFIAYILHSVFRQEGVKRSFRLVGILILVILLANIGHWTRNFGLWQHPLGDPEWLVQYQNESFGIPETLSNAVRNVVLHFGTPSSKVNAVIESAVHDIHRSLGINISEPSLTFLTQNHIVPKIGLLTHEDYAGNGLVLVLSIFALGFAIRTQAGSRIRPFAVLLCSSGLLFCIFFKWAPFNSRLHTPLFLLVAALVGWVLTPRSLGVSAMNGVWWKKSAVLTGLSLIASGVILNEWVIAWLFAPGGNIHSQPLRLGIWGANVLTICGGILAITWNRWYLRMVTALAVLIITASAFPWVALNQLRPLISTQYALSVFDRSRIEQMFANRGGLFGPYSELVSVLGRYAHCREIGLKIEVGAFEYPLWQLARHAEADLVFHHVAIDNKSAQIASRSSRESPCAVVVVGDDMLWAPDLSSLGKMHMIWSRPPIRLLVQTAAS